MAAALPSTRAAPIRRFIYLIIDGGNDSHTLHRIDTSPLFAAGVGARQGRAPPRAALPSPLARFECAAGRQFLPLGRGVEKIVGVDRHRHTVIFDTRTAAVRAGPHARHVKWHGHGSTWADDAGGGRLYHLGRGPGYEEPECLHFEALTYDRRRHDWFWSLLPSPPFEIYTPMSTRIGSFADAGAAGEASASAIRISAWDGTYAFDAARAAWRKEGDWALPFRGRAQYVADYGLWFGFTGGPELSDLGAADLNATGAPACRHVWANIDDGHGGSWLEFSYLSYLGSGRFCVTRFSRETDKDGSNVMTAVVTAVEATGELQMVSRASVRYHGPVCDSPCYWAPCWAY